MKKIIIAIDGPAASGKSTTAKAVARALGYLHMDSGAMYRAMGLKALQAGIDPLDAVRIRPLIGVTSIKLQPSDGFNVVFLDNIDVTNQIRTPAVSNAASVVSSIPEVRVFMVNEQRALGATGGIVMDGRDIGTVVFPNAELKVFMIADPRERARRRQKELAEKGIKIDEDVLVAELLERDNRDSTRSASPLRKADDAVVLDTTALTIQQQVDAIVLRAMERMK
ncbi:MAG: (d)CMP kinase [Ignavibacteriales bacterium]|nr:(d)CMP kinase [Ignavibacteriales bacterium]